MLMGRESGGLVLGGREGRVRSRGGLDIIRRFRYVALPCCGRNRAMELMLLWGIA